MDSGNSGSIQSSSGGGDDEYDPRNESISSFLNSSSTGNSGAVGFLTNTQSQLPLPSSSSSSTPFFFDQQPFSNYFSQPTPTPQQNIWSKDLRSDPNSTDVRGVFMPSSSTQPAHYIPNPSSSISLPPTSPSSSDQPNLTRPSKKRTRASRRAPTTVLTTDTSNFRAMVQEFTGIPAPPFSSSASPYQRTRHDLYNNNASSHFDPIRPPPYLLRPFAQKPLSSSPSMYVPSSSNQISTKNFQLLSELGLSKQPVMQNNSIQSLLQQSTVPHQKFFTPNLSNTRMTPIPLDHLPSFPTSDGMTIRENSITNSSHANEDGNQEHLRYGNHQVGKSCSDQESDQNVSSRGVGEGTVDSWINSSD